MPLLALKVVLAPFLIGGASLVARRWGPAIAGLLVGLPLTSGPLVFFVSLEQGPAFAVDVGLAVLAGGFALCAFALAYTRVAAARGGAAMALLSASAAYIVAAAVLRLVPTGVLWLLLAGVAVTLAVTLRLLPPRAAIPASPPPPAWDLPARIVVGTSLLLLLTAAAPILGPRVSGLIATYPVYVSVLTYFAHRQAGPVAGIALQRGLIPGLFGWLAFWAATLSLLVPAGVAVAFVVAVAAALTIQGLSLRLLRDAPVPGEVMA